jgi:hypothetical protein
MTTPQDSPDPEAEVLAHGAADDWPETVIVDHDEDEDDEPDVQAHAGWGTVS